MKNFVLAGSMAVVASGATATIPRSKGVSEFRKAAQVELKAHKAAIKQETTAEGKAALKKEKAVEAVAVAKEEGLFAQSSGGDMNMFEIRRGLTDCGASVSMVDGFVANRCVDTIYRDMYDDVGYAESEMYIKPNNGGFPIMFFFGGHGCNFDNIYWSFRMPKTEFGFPLSYSPGVCQTVTGASGPSFSQGAFWTDYKTVPAMPYGMQVLSNREAGCRKGKHYEYSSIANGLCMDDHHDDGTVSSWMIDVSDCANRNIIEREFSDAECNVLVDTTNYKVSDCLFDYESFNDDIHDADYWGATAYLEYTSFECSNGIVA
jgi:hypothetical protein